MSDLTPELGTTAGDAQAIIDTATRVGEPQRLDDDGRFFHVPTASGRVIDLEREREQFRANPRRKTGNYTVHDAESFLAYLAKHGNEDAEVWADYPAARLTGVLNAHGDVPEWEDHRVVYAVLHTDAWKAWTASDGRLMGQEEFAEHIEARSIDIVKPSAADMLEIAQTFHATNNVAFESATRLSDGQRQLRYREQLDAKAGRAGDLTIPETFTLALKPFEGADAYRVTARLRYRITEGNLRIGYKLDRPADVLREAFGGVVDAIREAATAPVLLGSR